MRDRVEMLTEGWSRLGHDLGFGVGIAQGSPHWAASAMKDVSTMRRSAASLTSQPGCAPRPVGTGVSGARGSSAPWRTTR
jgi:hypothetical protein